MSEEARRTPRMRPLPVWARSPPTWVDPLLAAAAAVAAYISLTSTDVTTVDPRLEPANLLGKVMTVIAALSLTWRRTHPVRGFAVFVLGCLVIALAHQYIGLLSILVLISLYSVAANASRRAGVWALIASIGSFLGLALLDVPDLRLSDLAEAGALLVTAWAVGDAVRSRRVQQEERLRLAEQEAEVAREHATRAAAEERLRIARELHDVVAHSMSLIAVQAGVGAHVIRSDVAAAEAALDVISETSRAALTQTRSLLGLLRSDSDQPAAPVPRLAELAALVAQVSESGVSVELRIEGDPRALDPGIELAAYRIVQESLTNVVKHAGARRAWVQIRYADELLIEVTDDGRSYSSRPPTDPGHGLRGLRERASLVGGVLVAGPRPSGGFQVRAELPYDSRANLP